MRWGCSAKRRAHAIPISPGVCKRYTFFFFFKIRGGVYAVRHQAQPRVDPFKTTSPAGCHTVEETGRARHYRSLQIWRRQDFCSLPLLYYCTVAGPFLLLLLLLLAGCCPEHCVHMTLVRFLSLPWALKTSEDSSRVFPPPLHNRVDFCSLSLCASGFSTLPQVAEVLFHLTHHTTKYY